LNIPPFLYAEAKLPAPTPIRLIAVDMDGTLLNDHGQVSPRNLAALQAARAAGVEIVVATGRRHSFAMRVLRPLNLPHACTLVSSNGTVTRTMGCCHPGQEPVASRLIARSHLSHDAALWLCGHLDEFRKALVLTFDRVGGDGDDTRGTLVVEHLDELNASIGRWMAANEPYIEKVNSIEIVLKASATDAPIQAMLCGTAERMRRAEARLLEHPGVVAVGHTPAALEPHHIIALHRTEYPARDLSILDILPAGCSKGAALLSLAATQSIPADQILAIGDNWNDVSMLEIAGSAVVMHNAPEDLKSLAGQRGWRIGPSNAQDGVAEAIESALAVSVVR
jgi:hydroxymethylpyrimidine pyrophosphatase-like HAD family hydrolase